MDVFPLLALKDSAVIKVPTDRYFLKAMRISVSIFFRKGSNLMICLKIEKIQSLDEAMAETYQSDGRRKGS